MGRADHPAAAGLLQRAVDVRSDDDRMHLRAMFELARVFLRRAEFERAESQLLATIELARTLGDKGILARARLGYSSLRVREDAGATVEDELAQAV